VRCSAIVLQRVHSVVVGVRDFEPGVAELGRLLGCEPAWVGRWSDRAGPTAGFALGNVELEVTTLPDADRRSVPWVTHLDADGEGLCALRLGVDDLAAGASDAAGGGRGRGEVRAIEASATKTGTVMATGAGRLGRSCRLDLEASRGIPVELVDLEPLCPGGRGAPGCDPATRVEALDHVVVLSPDPESTRAFYSGLGIRLALDRRFEERGVRLLFFRLGGVTIEVGARLGEPPRPEVPDRFGGLAWRVRDVDAVRARLASEGFDVSTIRRGHKPGTRVCTVRAPVHAVPTLLIQPGS
jgi:catechol 2,3-dioxygenase-like lactoylglutathione lyase family enzyme